jgi:uncharacterized membrane protein YtjA (UPF0391 family)
MLQWIITFLILAVVAGSFGFASLTGVFASIAQILFVVFLVLLIVSSFSLVLLRKTSGE